MLTDGWRIRALGASDAHVPESIGTAWTGVFAGRCTAHSIIKALRAGLCFASEASVMDFRCNDRPMGSRIPVRRGRVLRLRLRVADAAGVASVRLVSQGKVVREIRAHGEPLVEADVTRKAGTRPAYFRIESTATDDRRAFSTPIYTEPKGA